MTVETEVAALTTSVDALTSAVNVKRATLDASVTSASASATSAETHKNSANTLKTETVDIKDAAVTASSSAATSAASAYQDLTAIDDEIAVTATDVFVYDTSKDSDGGAWRNRTQGTSWYNEPLNTSTRGATKKFPAVAVIVAQIGKVTVYDADDPSMPMWMVFESGRTPSAATTKAFPSTGGSPSLTAKNGTIYVGNKSDGAAVDGLVLFQFIHDKAIWNSDYNGGYVKLTSPDLAQRNVLTTTVNLSSGVIVNRQINDVAVTVLPNAPTDPDTGLPVPTIAVATDGGVSVIKDDGNIVSKSSSLSNYVGHDKCDHIAFDGEDILFHVWNNTSFHTAVRWDYELTTLKGQYTTYEAIPSNTDNSLKLPFDTTTNANGMSGRDVVKTDDGVALAFDGYVVNAISDGNPQKDLINIVDTQYNTGWMLPDTKLATLMDTATGTITNTEYVTNGDFDTASDWTISPQQTGAGISNGQLEVISDGTNVNASQTLSGLTVGESYTLTFDYISRADPNAVGIAYLQYGGRNIYRTGALSPAAAGTYSFSFIAHLTSASLLIGTYANTGQGFTIDNVSVKRTVADRSAHDNGLQITGNITKEAVATGSELCAFVGGSNNYLTQPHNPDLDVIGDGTAHPYTMMGWFTNQNSDSYLGGQAILLTANLQTDQFISWQFNSTDGSVGVWVKNTSGTSQYTPADVIIKDQWNHVAWVNEGSNKFKIYVNGKFISEVALSTAAFPTDIADRELILCKNGQNKQALVKLSLSVPTAEQIAKIYRDEKPLFQEGANCTIYGNEKDVRALAFDEDTKLLHVGTTGSGDRGRSDFRGLQRVNNTTYGVATAISAANGLVVEE